MTADQAYVEGFCKAAEVAGVEPVALVKAALDPATAGGAAAMAIGGALGGSALTGDDQSFAKRVGKGTIGTALGYAGYKAMTDPRWQAGIRNGTQRAIDIIRTVMGRMPVKGASASPCVKSAGIVGGLLARGLGAGRRYLGLLAGGKVSALGDRVAKANRVIERAGNNISAARMLHAPQMLRNNQGILAGARRMATNAQAALAAEREAVSKARLLTGVGGGGVAAGMYLGRRDPDTYSYEQGLYESPELAV